MIFIIAVMILFIPCRLLFPIKKIGVKYYKELKKKKQNYILACNHMSNMDPVMLELNFVRKHRILAKKELFKNKFFGKILNQLGAISVDRQANDTAAVKQIFSALNKKKSVLIFPQGTRAKTPLIEGETAKEGMAMFSIRTGTPILPMMFDRKLRAFHRAKLYIGEPIYPDVTRKKDKEYLDEFANLIITKMNELIEKK